MPATQHRPFARHPILLAACGLVAACGGPPSADQQRATLTSWTATARLAAADLRERRTSTRYAKQIVARATAALAEERTMLATPGSAGREDDGVRAAADSLAATIRVLDAGIGGG